MKKIAVILSGCGVMDGSEIHESVATLLAISKHGAQYECLAPNIWQSQVIDHASNQVAFEKRNVLQESARIARGEIRDLRQAVITDYDAAIFPGGYGAVLNLCDFAKNRTNCSIEPQVLSFAKAMAQEKKPQGFICIAPAMVAKIYGSGVSITIGGDWATAQTMEDMGNLHQECAANDIMIDDVYRVVTTPAYMQTNNIQEVFEGIDKLVHGLLSMTSQKEARS